VKRKKLKILASLAAVLLLTAGTYGAIWWATYPSAPDPAALSFNDAAKYMGTDEFGRLTQRHQKRFALAVIDKSRQVPFKDLVAMMTADAANRRAAAKHIEGLSKKDKDEIGAAFLRAALDNFFAQSLADRQAYLLSMALAEKAARAAGPSTQPSGKKKPDGMQIPTPDQLEKEMSKIMSQQPPRTVAQMSQLFGDMRRTRDLLGMK
jgi:hypothetical protein